MSRWIVEQLGPEVPLHFPAYHPAYRMSTPQATPLQTLRRSRQIARDAGLLHVYTGNVDDRNGSSTRCSGCGGVVIQRDRYHISDYHLDEEGLCQACGTRCPGVFEGGVGAWNGRRQRVWL